MSRWMEDADAAWLAPESGEVRGAVLWLAEVGEPLPADVWNDAFREQGLAAVAPQQGDPWWTDRLAPAEPADSETAESRVLHLAEVAAERFGGVALAGVGAGGHGALRIAYKHPRRFSIAAAWRPAIDCHALLDRWHAPAVDVPADAIRVLRGHYDGDPERARQDSATLHIHPLNWPRHQRFDCPPADPWWEGCDRLRMKLSSLGVPHEADLETNADEAAAARRLVAWIAERFDEEARRVP